MSRAWMFSGTLMVKTYEEWMWAQTRKATLTLEDSDLIETMATRLRKHMRLVCLLS